MYNMLIDILSQQLLAIIYNHRMDMNDMEKMETVTQIFLVVYVVMKWLMKMKQFIVRVVASNGTTVTVLV